MSYIRYGDSGSRRRHWSRKRSLVSLGIHSCRAGEEIGIMVADRSHSGSWGPGRYGCKRTFSVITSEIGVR